MEKRIDERRFVAVKSAVMTWRVFDGTDALGTDIYSNDLLEERPDLKDAFTFCVMRAAGGFTFLFGGLDEGDDVVVRIGTVPEWNAGVKAVVATLRPEEGQAFVTVPRFIDEAHEHVFDYTVERRRDGKVLNSATDVFARRRRMRHLCTQTSGWSCPRRRYFIT